MPQLAALEAAAAPRIAPVDAVDVWQENLSAGRARPGRQRQPAGAGQRQPAGAGQRQPAGAGQRQPAGAGQPVAGTAVDPADEYLVDLWPWDFADQSHGVEG